MASMTIYERVASTQRMIQSSRQRIDRYNSLAHPREDKKVLVFPILEPPPKPLSDWLDYIYLKIGFHDLSPREIFCLERARKAIDEAEQDAKKKS